MKLFLPDAELIALAALVQVEAVVMAGDNEQRRIAGSIGLGQRSIEV